jgi:hypothetical protein
MSITMTGIWPYFIMIIGLILWKQTKFVWFQKIGEYMFFCGLFWITFSLLGHEKSISVGK